MLEIFLIYFAGFAIGYVLGWLGHAKSLLKRLTENPDEMIGILNEYKKNVKVIESAGVEGSAREIEVEKINDMFYLYAKDNGEFLAQAKTLDEALHITHQRFPNQVFQGVISSEEAKRLGLSS